MPGRAVAPLIMVLAAILVSPVTPAAPAAAALDGLTTFAIDGDTAGPDDWDDLPDTVVYDSAPEESAATACSTRTPSTASSTTST